VPEDESVGVAVGDWSGVAAARHEDCARLQPSDEQKAVPARACRIASVVEGC
jgi:hypothetical protein